MKKIIALLIIAVLAVSLAACGQERTNENTSDHSNSTIDTQKTESSMQTTDEMGQTLITLTIGDTVLEGYLNDSVPAKSLIAQLPLTGFSE